MGSHTNGTWRPSAYGFHIRSHAGTEIQTRVAARSKIAVITRCTAAAAACRQFPSQKLRYGSCTINSTRSPREARRHSQTQKGTFIARRP